MNRRQFLAAAGAAPVAAVVGMPSATPAQSMGRFSVEAFIGCSSRGWDGYIEDIRLSEAQLAELSATLTHRTRWAYARWFDGRSRPPTPPNGWLPDE